MQTVLEGREARTFGQATAIVDSVPDWKAIGAKQTALLMQRRDIGELSDAVAELVADGKFQRICHGSLTGALAMLGQLPPLLATDVASLAQDFAQLVGARDLRIRLECVTTNACRKVHVDRTNLRLITTYSGPGTQVLGGNDERSPDELWTVPTGWIGLFKGSLFGDGHAQCRHRSPPAGDMGARRLVLVIDSPAFADGRWRELQAT